MSDGQRLTPQEARALFEVILAKAKDRKTAGEEIRQFRKGLGFTPSEFVSRLNVSRQTLDRWEKNNSAPKLELVETRFVNLLPPDNAELKTIERVGIRLAEHVLDLESKAERVWIFSAHSFYEGQNDTFAIAVTKNIQAGVHYAYVYPDIGKVEAGEAKASFENLKTDIERVQKRKGVVYGYALKSAELIAKMGLSTLPTTLIILEYQEDKWATLKRRRDIFLHTLVAQYNDNLKKGTAFAESISVWLELPQKYARAIWNAWEKIQEDKDNIEITKIETNT